MSSSSTVPTLEVENQSLAVLDPASFLTGIVVGNLFVNGIVAVTLYYLDVVVIDAIKSKDSTTTPKLYNHYLFDMMVGVTSGAAIRSAILSRYWLIGHVFCVVTVILSNGVIDFTYTLLSDLPHLKRQHPWLMNVMKTTRGFIVALWMTALLYCIVVLDRYNRVTAESEDIAADTRTVFAVVLPSVLVNFLFVWMYVQSRSACIRCIKLDHEEKGVVVY